VKGHWTEVDRAKMRMGPTILRPLVSF